MRIKSSKSAGRRPWSARNAKIFKRFEISVAKALLAGGGGGGVFDESLPALRVLHYLITGPLAKLAFYFLLSTTCYIINITLTRIKSFVLLLHFVLLFYSRFYFYWPIFFIPPAPPPPPPRFIGILSVCWDF